MKVSKEKGITLIALVITIIVLLILAGISIATLTGENGVLTKANTAKEQSEIEEIKERAKTDILGIQIENKTGNITEAQFSEILKKYDKDGKSDKVDKNGEKIIETTKKQIIKASEIYNGPLLTKRVFYIAEVEIEYKENMAWTEDEFPNILSVLQADEVIGDGLWDVMSNNEGVYLYGIGGIPSYIVLNENKVQKGEKIVEGAHYNIY